MREAAPIAVQTTQGATGKFLDPSANARSCLAGCALLLLLGALFWFFGLAKVVFG